MNSRNPNGFALILLGTALLPWLGCSSKNTEVVAAPAPAPATGPVPRRSGEHSSETDSGFAVSGPLIVEHQLDVLAQRDGVIADLRSDAGTRVHAGDLLAQLDDRQLSADLEAARAKTRSTEADLKTWEAEAKVHAG